MNAALLSASLTLVRAWTWTYTAGLPADRRDARREEIESDLWECQHDDSHTALLPLTILTRLLLGMADDVAWRGDYRGVRPVRTALAVIVTVLLLAAVAWIGIVGSAATLPPRPPDLFARPFQPAPHPPPPPPPPCPPAGLGPPPASPCTRF